MLLTVFAALSMVNNKTTPTRIIPILGKEAGDFMSFGGLFDESVNLLVGNVR